MRKDDVAERAMTRVRERFGAENVQFDRARWSDQIRFKLFDDNGAVIGAPIRIDRWEFKSETLLAERLANERETRNL